MREGVKQESGVGWGGKLVTGGRRERSRDLCRKKQARHQRTTGVVVKPIAVKLYLGILRKLLYHCPKRVCFFL